MNKKILAIVLAAAISFSSAITAFAADTLNTISLDDKAKFSVTLQSNSLVFTNEPTDKTYDSIVLEVCNVSGTVFSKTTYDRGQGNGATLDLSDVPDGSYIVKVGYVNKGFKQYPGRYAYNLEVKSGVGTFKPISYYAQNLKATANERTDATALSLYKTGASAAEVAQANIITAGITNDYDKVKAIHDWVANNMYYDYSDRTTVMGADANSELYPGGPLKRGLCGSFAGATAWLMKGAGFPAKIIAGGAKSFNNEYNLHEWTEVYVDGRWVFMDTQADSGNSFSDGKFSNPVKCAQTYFDMPMAEWSFTHVIGASITDQDKAVDIYSAPRVSSVANNIKTNSFTVKFDSQGGTAVDSMSVTREANGTGKVPVPATPTKAGYTFKGWVVGNPYNSVMWDFNKNVISYDVTFYAKWQAN